MRPTGKELALRDPALAAYMGVLPGSDFGHESRFGAEFGDEFGDEIGAEFGDEFGLAKVPQPTQAQAMAAWKQLHMKKAHTHRRELMLEPNKGSDLKVERYSFSITQVLALGTAVALSMSGSPDTNIRPQRVMMNAPTPGFCTISEIKVANVSVTSGTGDAIEYGPNAVGGSLDMPTLSPANKATVLGNYTGFLPPGFVLAAAYTFVTSFKGPATIVA